MMNPLRILYTGRFYDTAPRGRALREGLRQRGHDVTEVAIDHEVRRPWGLRLGRRLAATPPDFDAVVLADLGQLVVDPVAAYCRRHSLPLVVDFFFPMYEAMVHDRGVLSPDSWRASRFRRMDHKSLAVADAVFFDTLEHLLSTEELYPNSFHQGHVVPIGCPLHFFEEVSPKTLEGSGAFNVLFWGSYIPLQGIEHILEAARLLKTRDSSIRFFLIGKSGLTYHRMRDLARQWSLDNVVFVPRIPQDQLRSHIVAADLALGIFGDTDKAHRVVPHKVYEAMAMGVPTITRDSPASRHLLPPESCRLVEPFQLADAILALRQDESARISLGRAGARVSRERFHPDSLGQKLEDVICSAIQSAGNLIPKNNA